MATHDYVLANQSGSSFRSDLNNALAAIVSQNSSATEPATTYAYQYWIDTSATPALVKQRNAANDAWVTLAEVDGQTLIADGTNAKPGLAFASDTNTGIRRESANEMSLVTNGSRRLTVKSTGRVGIGTDVPGGPLEVETNTGERVIVNSRGSNQQPRIQLVRDGGADYSFTNSEGEFKIERDSSEIYKFITGTTHVFNNLVQIQKPNDWWSAGSHYKIDGLGSLASEGSFRVSLTSNGYRDTNNQWVSLNANGQSGAAQIGLDPTGHIFFHTDASKATGSAASITTQMVLGPTGCIGLGVDEVVNVKLRVEADSSSNLNYAHIFRNSNGINLEYHETSGKYYNPSIYGQTTSGGANVNVISGGYMRRSTSSSKYKTNIETLEDSYADAILDSARPVWYRSSCPDDNQEWGWYGFVAEEIAEIDPRLVSWSEKEEYNDEDGLPKLRDVETPEPEGVMYERFVPMLVNLVKRQKAAIETLETKVAALEAAN